jgi:hypothetical protein
MTRGRKRIPAGSVLALAALAAASVGIYLYATRYPKSLTRRV